MKPNWHRLGAAFLLGAVLGVLAGSYFQRIAIHRFWSQRSRTDKIVKRLTNELKLDDDQQAKIKTLIERSHDQVLSLQKETSDKFDQIRMSSRADITKMLRPDQLERFKAMTARWDARRSKTEVEIHR